MLLLSDLCNAHQHNVKMKLMSIAVCRWNQDTEEAVVLDGAFNLAEYNFFQRGRFVGLGAESLSLHFAYTVGNFRVRTAA